MILYLNEKFMIKHKKILLNLILNSQSLKEESHEYSVFSSNLIL